LECAKISDTTITNLKSEAGYTYFNCNVSVENKNAVANDIACGIATDQNPYPKNNCKSDGKYFGGWQGNTAVFNCIVTDPSDLNPQNHPKLIGYDFNTQKKCPISEGKSISLSSIPFEPSTASTTDYATAAKTILEQLFAKGIALIDPNYSPPTNLPNVLPQNTTPQTQTPQPPPTESNPQSNTLPVDLNNFTHYCQCNPQWGVVGGGICQSGCGLTTIANILSSFGRPTTPQDMRSAFEGKYWSASVGMNSTLGALQSGWFQQRGFQPSLENLVSGGKLNTSRAKRFFTGENQNRCALIGSTSAHIFAVTGINDDGSITVHDPYYGCNAGGQGEKVSFRKQQPSYVTYYAYALCKM
jgi:hypothetical protein